MADAIPIRPSCAHQKQSVTSFLTACIAEFIAQTEQQPRGGILILFDEEGRPIISTTRVSRAETAFVAARLTQMALDKDCGITIDLGGGNAS